MNSEIVPKLDLNSVLKVRIVDSSQPWTAHDTDHLVNDAYGTACGIRFATPLDPERIEQANDEVFDSPLDVSCLRCWGTDRFRSLVLRWHAERRLH